MPILACVLGKSPIRSITRHGPHHDPRHDSPYPNPWEQRHYCPQTSRCWLIRATALYPDFRCFQGVENPRKAYYALLLMIIET